MRSSLTVVLGLCVACEREPIDETPPAAPAVAPDAEVTSPPSFAGSAPIEVDPRIDKLAKDPSGRLISDGDLPQPPTDEPKAYRAWLASLSPQQQLRIRAFCRTRPLDYEYECGGIGPLHVPVPPVAEMMRDLRELGEDETAAMGPPIYFASMQSWRSALSPAQRRYVDRFCTGEDSPHSDLCGPNTPLVIAFDAQPIEFATSAGAFAFAPGSPVASDWPTATTPWLALDRDHSGTIDSGAELFGDRTRLPDGSRAVNGFAALAALDDNRDGRIDASDAAFASLALWSDRDGDRATGAGELTPLANQIVSISLADTLDVRCDARGNCEGERAAMTWRDAAGTLRTGAVVDVYLPTR